MRGTEGRPYKYEATLRADEWITIGAWSLVFSSCDFVDRYR